MNLLSGVWSKVTPLPDKLLSSEVASYPDPANMIPRDASLFESIRSHTFLPCSAYLVKNAVLWAHPLFEVGGRVWKPATHYRFDTSEPQFGKLEPKRLLGNLKAERLSFDSALFFFDHYTNRSIYHWLCEAIPRYILLSERFGSMHTVLLPECHTVYQAYQEESLKWFGFNGAIHRASYTKGYKVPSLFTCDLVMHPGCHRPHLVRKVRAVIRQYFSGKQSAQPSDLIYISREYASHRRSINEASVQQMLKAKGFQIVHLEKLSPREQVLATLNAKVIVGSHGGGLPAMLYAPEDCVVLELRNARDNVSNCYYSLATSLGLPYHYLLCQPSGIVTGFNDDVAVDINDLDSLLSHALSLEDRSVDKAEKSRNAGDPA
jgi:capsular polysaccharide biosynthesis protein